MIDRLLCKWFGHKWSILLDTHNSNIKFRYCYRCKVEEDIMLRPLD